MWDPQGAEAAVHAARIYLHNLPADHVLLNSNFSNAFNFVHRDQMLIRIRELAPELLPLVHSTYSAPFSFFWGETTLQSSEGVQQGDPLGPLMFCLAIQPLIERLISEFVVFYLDDGLSVAGLGRPSKTFRWWNALQRTWGTS